MYTLPTKGMITLSKDPKFLVRGLESAIINSEMDCIYYIRLSTRTCVMHTPLFFFLVQALTSVGRVVSILESGDLRIKYMLGRQLMYGYTWTICADAVVKVSTVCMHPVHVQCTTAG